MDDTDKSFLRQVLLLAQNLNGEGSSSTHSPTSHGDIPTLVLSPLPDIERTIRELGLPGDVAQALQRTFQMRLTGYQALLVEACQREVPHAQAALEGIQGDRGSDTYSRRVIWAFKCRVEKRFESQVLEMRSLVLDKVQSWLSRNTSRPSAPVFTKVRVSCLFFCAPNNTDATRPLSYRPPSTFSARSTSSTLNPTRPRSSCSLARSGWTTSRFGSGCVLLPYPLTRVSGLTFDSCSPSQFQNRRNRKAVSARTIEEERRIAKANGITPAKAHKTQPKPVKRVEKKTQVKKKAAARSTSVKVRPFAQEGDENDREMDFDCPTTQYKPSPLDANSFNYHGSSNLGYGRPSVSTSTSPDPYTMSASSSQTSFNVPSSSHPSNSMSYQSTPQEQATASPEQSWNLVPIQPAYYSHAPDPSFLPPLMHRSASYASSSTSPSTVSDLDSLWSIASTDPASTYSNFYEPPCVPTSLDFTPPPPSDESSLTDPMVEPSEYLLSSSSSSIPTFSFSPSPPPLQPPEFSTDTFRALLDSSSGDMETLWEGGDVLELTEEIDQVLREYTPEGETFDLFDFNIPQPAAAW